MSMRPFLWSIRRELWENRSIYLAPIAVAAVFFVGFALSSFGLPKRIRAAAAIADPLKQREMIAFPYEVAAGLLMLTLILVSVFYCLDALYGERRDRSTLFWKSMPVSDTEAVLAKASIPMVLLPLITFVVTWALQLAMLLLSTVVIAASGESVAFLWGQLSFGRISTLLVYHLVTVHGFWQWPAYAWLLMVSAWSRRAPLIWAVLPPLVLCFVEKVVFDSSWFAQALLSRFMGGGGMDVVAAKGMFPIHPAVHVMPLRFVTAPGLWIGFLITAVFLAAAIRLRRSRGAI